MVRNTLKTSIAALAMLCAPALTSPYAFATAEGGQATRPVVVELFTSQGCSSCPPADAVLAEIAGRSDVVALGFHVDY